MNKIGILLNNIGPSQLAYYLIRNGNSFVESGLNDLIAFFYEIAPECSRMKFSSMHMSEAYNYNGILVATDVNSASRILEFPGTTKRFFYVWDLEWTKLPNKQFEQLRNVYNNNNLPLIVRSQVHYDILKKIWKAPIGVCDDCDVDRLYKIISEYIDGHNGSN